jgi:alkylation response protein AidB-like acyl-CoA dehydrogenase
VTVARAVVGRGLLDSATEPRDVFTRDEMTDEQRQFGRTAAEFMRHEVLPAEPRLRAHEWSVARALIRRAGDLDLLRVEIPTVYGGLGLDAISSASVAESTSLSPSFAVSLAAHAGLGIFPLVHFGTDDQKRRYLPRLGSGELIGAYALTEAQSGSDALSVRTIAQPDDGGRCFRLSGVKAWITNGGFADLFTVFAQVEGRGLTAFLVDRTAGVTSGREEAKLGLDGSSTTTVTLDDVRVPAENVLGRIGEGHRVAFSVLNLGRVKLGVRNVAWAKQALAAATAYACQRRQFNAPIVTFGLIRRKLAEMVVRCYVGEAMVYRTLGAMRDTAASLDDRDPGAARQAIDAFAVECSATKVWTSEGLGLVVDEAVQIHGANGYSREFPVERAYRDARITRIFEGTNEINRLIVARRLLKLSAATPLPAIPVAARDRDDRHEWELVRRIKLVMAQVIEGIHAAYGGAADAEQEALACLADIAIETYALDSALATATKARAVAAEPLATVARDVARVCASQTAACVARAAKELVGALPAPQQAGLRRVMRDVLSYECGNVIAARRRIADAAVAASGYPF